MIGKKNNFEMKAWEGTQNRKQYKLKNDFFYHKKIITWLQPMFG